MCVKTQIVVTASLKCPACESSKTHFDRRKESKKSGDVFKVPVICGNCGHTFDVNGRERNGN